MSNMYGAGGGMPRNSPTFKITMKEYEDMAIKVGDRVGIEVKKVDRTAEFERSTFSHILRDIQFVFLLFIALTFRSFLLDFCDIAEDLFWMIF